MGTEVPDQNYTTGGNHDDDDDGNLRSGDLFVDGACNEVRNNGSSQPPADGGDRISDIDSRVVTESSLDHRDEASNTIPNSPAKFCFLRATSKFCSQCGTKRFGI